MNESSLLLKQCGSRKSQLKTSMLAVLLLGLMAHGMQFLSLAPTHDYLFSFFEKEGEYVNALELGRYLQPVFRAVTGTAAAAPWSIGLISLGLIGLAVYGTAQMFEIRNQAAIWLLAGLMVTNQAVTATAGTYMTYLGPFCLSLTLSVFAALCWKQFRETRKISHLAVGALLAAASAGLYQAYLFVTMTWILLDSLRGILKDRTARQVILDGLAGLAMVLVGVGIYFALLTPVTALTGVALKQGDYNSVSNVWQGGSSMISGLIRCYRHFILGFATEFASVLSRPVMAAVHLTLFLLTGGMLAMHCRREKKSAGAIVLALLMLAALPLASLGIVIINGEMHDLMKYALCGVYLLPLMGLQLTEKPGKGLAALVAALMAVLIFSNIQTANVLYTEKQLEFDGTFSLMTNVLGEIEKVEGYEPGVTRVLFLGYPQDVTVKLPYKDQVEHITGGEVRSAITHPTKYGYFFRNILQRDVNVIMEEDFRMELPPMPQYPQKGSIQMVDGIVVVNLTAPQ